MKVVAIIPARYKSERFPYKLMQNLNGKTVINTTYQNVKKMNVFHDIIVVTDSNIILNEIKKNGGNAIMSKKEHECGSDRIAEVAKDINADIFINVQGDEPFTKKETLLKLIDTFKKEKNIDLASVKSPLSIEDAKNINTVKVITDIKNNAIYFSRSLIPFDRDKNHAKFYKHIGIYAFTKKALVDFSNYKQTPLELSEKIECLRFLENGKKIKMIDTNEDNNISIDTKEDLEKALKLLKKNT